MEQRIQTSPVVVSVTVPSPLSRSAAQVEDKGNSDATMTINAVSFFMNVFRQTCGIFWTLRDKLDINSS
jgi:hypothetical protein